MHMWWRDGLRVVEIVFVLYFWNDARLFSVFTFKYFHHATHVVAMLHEYVYIEKHIAIKERLIAFDE